MGELFIGLMSGTSADGIDAVLMAFDPAPKLLATHYTPYADSLRSRIRRFASAAYAADAIDELGALDAELGQLFAAAALALLEEARVGPARVKAVGSHGQTVRHRPRGPHPFTLQIADANVIAARTGLTVVADFRRRDVALGGQGAPLLPAFHRAAFGHASEERVVVNIGGIANITLLPPQGEVRGFDTGPGNVLMDHWSREHQGKPYDSEGAYAATGRVDDALLTRLLADPYFAAPPPKSTGPEHFNAAWLEQALGTSRRKPEDVAATLAELTARSIAEAVRRQAPGVKRVYACGGGAHNMHLMARLASLLPGITLASTAALGIDPDWVEAAGFAWLARETLERRPGNLPSVTGAAQYSILGAIHPGK
ncbi:MAG TPA: anhydro-N-acetylmuramic acid kinase [Gammaproteobacteria bacterium]|nr:anhydro-N-acetylmuramic acid kinase [Gammaproteobacteria bacterium]